MYQKLRPLVDEIMRLRQDGMTDEEAARQLNLKPHKVRNEYALRKLCEAAWALDGQGIKLS